jgi:hypothetical protein
MIPPARTPNSSAVKVEAWRTLADDLDVVHEPGREREVRGHLLPRRHAGAVARAPGGRRRSVEEPGDQSRLVRVAGEQEAEAAERDEPLGRQPERRSG